MGSPRVRYNWATFTVTIMILKLQWNWTWNNAAFLRTRFSFYIESLVAQRLKHLPGMRDTRVQSLGWEDPLEKEMATHSSTLAWRIPRREEPGRLQSMGWPAKSRTWLSAFTFTFIGLECNFTYKLYTFKLPTLFMKMRIQETLKIRIMTIMQLNVVFMHLNTQQGHLVKLFINMNLLGLSPLEIPVSLHGTWNLWLNKCLWWPVCGSMLKRLNPAV